MDPYNQYEEIKKRSNQIALEGIQQILLYLFPDNPVIRVQLMREDIPIEWLAGMQVTLNLNQKDGPATISFQTKIDPMLLVDGSRRWVQVYLKPNSDWEAALFKEITPNIDIGFLSVKIDEKEEYQLALKVRKRSELLFIRKIAEDFEEDFLNFYQELEKIIDADKVLENLSEIIYLFDLLGEQERQVSLHLKFESPPIFSTILKKIKVIAVFDDEEKNIEIVRAEPRSHLTHNNTGNRFSLYLKADYDYGKEIKTIKLQGEKIKLTYQSVKCGKSKEGYLYLLEKKET